jgi:hypothetical protein
MKKMEWIKKEQDRLKLEKEAKMKELGYRPFRKLVVGNNRVILDLVSPPRITKDGNYIFHLEEEEFDLGMSRYLYEMLMRKFEEWGQPFSHINIIRVGVEKEDTRYDIVQWFPEQILNE